MRKIRVHLSALHRPVKDAEVIHKFYSEYLMKRHVAMMKRKNYIAAVVVKNPGGSIEVTYRRKQPERNQDEKI